MDGISKFDVDSHKEELKRIQKICDGAIKGIVSNQITEDELSELKSTADECKEKKSTSTKDYTKATYAIASYRGASLSVKGRRFMRTKGLQGRTAAVYMRALIIANFK